MKIKVLVILSFYSLFLTSQNCASISSYWNTAGQNLSSTNNKIGSCNAIDFILKSNDSSRIYIKANGKIGFNTSEPTAALTLNSKNVDAFKIIASDSSNKMINIVSSRTDKPTFVLFGTGKTIIGSQQIAPSHIHSNAFMQVSGKIACKELVVIDPSKWADFVFKPAYKLMPLPEVESFYKSHQHLPDVPSEEEVKRDGLNTADMDAILLQKIEELTLYVVELNKKIENLKLENSNLKVQGNRVTQ